MRVAYLGPAGTYSEEALRASAPGPVEEIPYPTIRDAVMAVQAAAVDRAVVPIENALEGAVAVTLDTLATDADRVRIAAEVVHPIHHCAIAARPLALDEVTRVVSHPQASAQCARFLRERLPHTELVAAPSTADAVLSVRAAAEPALALGSRLAAELYDCVVLASDVEDHPDNATRFVWLAPADATSTPGDAPSPKTPGDAPSPKTPDDALPANAPGDAPSPRTPGDAASPKTPDAPSCKTGDAPSSKTDDPFSKTGAPSCKTSVVFWGGGDQSPGWLVAALREFADRNVNLTRIESRPRRIRLGHYMFFADLEGAADEPPVSEALAALRHRVEEVRVLGSYGSVGGPPG